MNLRRSLCIGNLFTAYTLYLYQNRIFCKKLCFIGFYQKNNGKKDKKENKEKNGNKDKKNRNRKTIVKKLVRRSYLIFSTIELIHFNNS